ncbi:virulence associated protein D, partial [Campylobacter upsaliensis]|nr:virulence associated protein D [Campylobacter upsaliensis]
MELKNRHKKCINFDLDTKELLKYFPKGTRKPYALIKEFFEKQGFDHRQYSGYISK